MGRGNRACLPGVQEKVCTSCKSFGPAWFPRPAARDMVCQRSCAIAGQGLEKTVPGEVTPKRASGIRPSSCIEGARHAVADTRIDPLDFKGLRPLTGRGQRPWASLWLKLTPMRLCPGSAEPHSAGPEDPRFPGHGRRCVGHFDRPAGRVNEGGIVLEDRCRTEA